MGVSGGFRFGAHGSPSGKRAGAGKTGRFNTCQGIPKSLACFLGQILVSIQSYPLSGRQQMTLLKPTSRSIRSSND